MSEASAIFSFGSSLSAFSPVVFTSSRPDFTASPPASSLSRSIRSGARVSAWTSSAEPGSTVACSPSSGTFLSRTAATTLASSAFSFGSSPRISNPGASPSSPLPLARTAASSRASSSTEISSGSPSSSFASVLPMSISGRLSLVLAASVASTSDGSSAAVSLSRELRSFSPELERTLEKLPPSSALSLRP